MKFALITPPAGEGPIYAHRLSYHMALAQGLMNDPAYMHMYKRIKHNVNGAFIMVDNGAAEGDRQPFDEVVRVANEIGADEIVMPDELRDAQWTIEYTTDAAAMNIVPPRKRVVVPQGTTLQEWAMCLRRLIEAMEFRTIGVPKHLDATIPGGRAEVLEFLETWSFHTRYDIHLLGLNRLEELRDLAARFPWVRGIDTGMPIGWAQDNMLLGFSTEHHPLQWHNDFDEKLAEANIAQILTLCRKEDTCM